LIAWSFALRESSRTNSQAQRFALSHAQAIEAEFAQQIGAESAVFAKQKCALILKISLGSI
jgi:hypothetical protein